MMHLPKAIHLMELLIQTDLRCLLSVLSERPAPASPSAGKFGTQQKLTNSPAPPAVHMPEASALPSSPANSLGEQGDMDENSEQPASPSVASVPHTHLQHSPMISPSSPAVPLISLARTTKASAMVSPHSTLGPSPSEQNPGGADADSRLANLKSTVLEALRSLLKELHNLEDELQSATTPEKIVEIAKLVREVKKSTDAQKAGV